MGYVEESLAADETVRYRARTHWGVFFGPAAFIAVVVVLFEVLPPVAMILARILAVVAVIFFVRAWIVYGCSEFAVTNRRVIMKRGLVSRQVVDLLLAKIECVEIQQGITGRLFNFGSLSISGTGGSSEIFSALDAPFSFRKAVQEESTRMQADTTRRGF